LSVSTTAGDRTIASFPTRPSRADEGPRVNNQIRADKVRVIDADGEMLGVLSTREAVLKAQDLGLDLIEISPGADPPVCKIGDVGKHRYEMQKKAHAAKKNQKIVLTKELKFRPNIEEHDVQVKLRNARRFFEDGDKVRFILQFRGREAEHKEFGWALINRVKQELINDGKIEMEPRQEGNAIVMIMTGVVKV
jgi:translation initiation factor IF-3